MQLTTHEIVCITTGRTVTQESLDYIYSGLNKLTDDNLDTHQLVVAYDIYSQPLIEMFPWAYEGQPREEDGVDAFLTWAHAVFDAQGEKILHEVPDTMTEMWNKSEHGLFTDFVRLRQQASTETE